MLFKNTFDHRFAMDITLDGNSISCLEDFYKQLESTLEKGECPWGANLDSLQEVVDMHFNYTGNPSLNIDQIFWLNMDKSKTALGIPETLRWLKIKQKNSTSIEHHRIIENWMSQVETGLSETLFDILKEILSSNPLIEFKGL